MTLHFYTPLAAYPQVFKYRGMVSERNREWFPVQNPGTVIVTKYLGDRIPERLALAADITS
jgi:hypothetical protein